MLGGDVVAVWDVALSDGVYRIQFSHGTTTGRRIVYVNGQEVIRRDRMFKLVGRETFSVGGANTRASVLIEAVRGLAYEYSLQLEGRSLQRVTADRDQTCRTWRVRADGEDCRVVLEKDTMDVWCNGQKMDTTNKSACRTARVGSMCPGGRPRGEFVDVHGESLWTSTGRVCGRPRGEFVDVHGESLWTSTGRVCGRPRGEFVDVHGESLWTSTGRVCGRPRGQFVDVHGDSLWTSTGRVCGRTRGEFVDVHGDSLWTSTGTVCGRPRGQFVDDGTETRFVFGEHECCIKATSSGRKKGGIVHHLLLDGASTQ